MEHILILGGDERQRYLARLLCAEKGVLSICRLPEDYDTGTAFSLEAAMERAHILICPVPFTKNGVTIFSASQPDFLTISYFLKQVSGRHILFGGAIPAQVKTHCAAQNTACFDFMDMEEVALFNSIATAEGAIAEAIRLSPENLHHSRCLVLGFGRCGQTLAEKLRGLNARVTVADQKALRRSCACTRGFDSVALEDIKRQLHCFSFLFNTIPAPVLTEALISELSPGSIIIDIASAPGGTDFDACKKAGIHAKLCTGLPGIYSPKASAKILCDAVCTRL